MLVLSRKEGEQLVIGDNITLVISKISGNRVTIGIEAPKDVKIVRSELSATEDLVGAVVKAKLHTPRGSGLGQKSIGLKEFAGSVLTLKRNVG